MAERPFVATGGSRAHNEHKWRDQCWRTSGSPLVRLRNKGLSVHYQSSRQNARPHQRRALLGNLQRACSCFTTAQQAVTRGLSWQQNFCPILCISWLLLPPHTEEHTLTQRNSLTQKNEFHNGGLCGRGVILPNNDKSGFLHGYTNFMTTPYINK